MIRGHSGTPGGDRRCGFPTLPFCWLEQADISVAASTGIIHLFGCGMSDLDSDWGRWTWDAIPYALAVVHRPWCV